MARPDDGARARAPAAVRQRISPSQEKIRTQCRAVGRYPLDVKRQFERVPNGPSEQPRRKPGVRERFRASGRQPKVHSHPRKTAQLLGFLGPIIGQRECRLKASWRSERDSNHRFTDVAGMRGYLHVPLLDRAMSRCEDLIRFYALLEASESRWAASAPCWKCSARMSWPQRVVYFFFEDGEARSDTGSGLRVVRVGTHALTGTSKSTLWKRLRQHRGTDKSGGGNHRGSGHGARARPPPPLHARHPRVDQALERPSTVATANQ